jgi:hypothetical protein
VGIHFPAARVSLRAFVAAAVGNRVGLHQSAVKINFLVAGFDYVLWVFPGVLEIGLICVCFPGFIW